MLLRSLLMLLILTATAACNTVEGVGQDIGAAGQAISGTAQQTKEKMK